MHVEITKKWKEYIKKKMNFFLTGILFVFSLQLQWSLTPNRSREEERDNLNTGLFKLYTYPLPTNHGVIVAILKIGIVIWLRTRRTVTSNYSLREKNETKTNQQFTKSCDHLLLEVHFKKKFIDYIINGCSPCVCIFDIMHGNIVLSSTLIAIHRLSIHK